jgi:hypothetical protein
MLRPAHNGARRTRRSVAALAAVLASAGCLVASFLTWLSLSDGAGGTTSVSGWGAISGGSQIAGENINDALNGNATFRPGLLAVILGSIALLAALGMAIVARRGGPMRILASVLVLSGSSGVAWGIVRGTAPDSLGLLNQGERAGAGAGPWLLTGCSAVLLAVALAIFFGLLDPPVGGTLGAPADPLRRTGIQPR